MKKLILPLVMGAFMLLSGLGLQAQNAFVQLIHNSPDPAADSVDVYVNGTLIADDFPFRGATPFLPLLPNVTVNVGVAPKSSNSVNDTIANFAYVLAPGQTVTAIASGVLNPALFDTMANGAANIAFGVQLLSPALTNPTGNQTTIAAFHGAPDAPAVDVIANGGMMPLIGNLAYNSFSGVATVPSTEYLLDVNVAGTSTTAASYYVNLFPALASGNAVIFASGFLNPANNQGGEAFGLFAALADGTVLPLQAVGNARVQVIHNFADPIADTVDVYVNWLRDSLKLDNFPFRGATPFVDLPSGFEIDIQIAPKNSTSSSDKILDFSAPFMDGETYNVIVNGVADTTQFASNPDGKNISPSILSSAGAREVASAGDVDLRVLHGSTDAPTVGVAANGGLIVPSASYGDLTGYLGVDAAEYRIDITAPNDPSTVIAPFYVDISGLTGGAGVVFASGFLDPSANQNGEAFGLFAALADGTVVELQSVGNARVQVIHNSADPAADTVDVYVNWLTDSLKLDNFAFRAATAFVDLPTGYPVSIGIAGKGSSTSSDAIATFTPTLASDETYAVVANGVLDTTQFAANPDGASTAFTLFVEMGVRETASDGDIDLKVLHGATDAPTVGVNANGNAVVPAAGYGAFTGYLGVAEADYRIDVTGANDPSTLVAPFYIDLNGLSGGASLVFASGFLDPTANQNGEAFGLFAALPDGTVAELTAVGSGRAQVIHNSADPAADTVDVYINALADTIFLDDFAFRTATPFVDVPTEYPLRIVIAPSTSTSIADGIATIPATLMNGESYHIVANGVLDPSSFAANPDGEATGFTLFATNLAQEAAVDTNNVELRVFHGATDAPTVDVIANLSTPALVSNLKYGDFQGYLSVPPADYQLGITTAGGGVAGLVAQFLAPATGLKGGAGIILASGFLDPTTNQDGEAFGLLLVLADGTAILLTNTTGIYETLLVNDQLLSVYPNPATTNVNLDIEVENPGQVDVAIFDAAGRKVWSRSENLFPGQTEWNVDAMNLSAGVHTVVMKTETSISTKKLVLVR
jgi:hypothetical protein